MADELQITSSLTYASGKARAAVAQEILKVTQTTQLVDSGFWVVGTSEEDLALREVTTPGYMWVKNLDGANFVKYGPKSAGAMIEFGRIKAGESAIFRVGPSGVTIRAIADTGAVKLQYLLFND